MNFPEVLEIVNTAKENTQQIQLFPGLSALLPSKMTQNQIITSDAVYETVHAILSRGMNETSSRVLGFLRASLRAAAYADGPARECAARVDGPVREFTARGDGPARADGPGRECAARTRKLLLRSGCLQDMLDIFLSSTTDDDNWKVLCECLVEACRDCEENQNYCSCLIPVCVQRCNTMNKEIFKLLHCLLMNNTNNINLFVESNGTSIFTKESIHDSSRMELLSVVVQNSSAANLLKRNTNLLNSLILVGEEYKDNCEGSWKMVEWASVILFHLASHIEGVDKSIGITINKSDFDHDMNNSETTLNDLTVSFLLKPNWDKVKSRNINYHQLECSTTSMQGFCFKPFSDDHMSIRHSNMIDFVPKFVSTPKRKITKTNEHIAELRKQNTNSTMVKSNNVSQRVANGDKCASIIKKTISTSARLFNIVNNSCISICHTMGTIFSRNPTNTKSRRILKQECKEGLENKLSKYMKQRYFHTDTKVGDKLNAAKLRRKLAINQKYHKGIVKKLKTGMHFYGCNFKKIAQAMWSHEKQMTPKRLYRIYRKFIAK